MTLLKVKWSYIMYEDSVHNSQRTQCFCIIEIGECCWGNIGSVGVILLGLYSYGRLSH